MAREAVLLEHWLDPLAKQAQGHFVIRPHRDDSSRKLHGHRTED
jgi:hypothetical protein